MGIFHIYFNSSLDLDQTATLLTSLINCNNRNQSKWQLDQKRHGINYGGDYYLFEVMGLEIKLIKNEGEVLVETFLEYEYFLFCSEITKIDESLFKSVVSYLGLYLTSAGLKNKVIEF